MWGANQIILYRKHFKKESILVNFFSGSDDYWSSLEINLKRDSSPLISTSFIHSLDFLLHSPLYSSRLHSICELTICRENPRNKCMHELLWRVHVGMNKDCELPGVMSSDSDETEWNSEGMFDLWAFLPSLESPLSFTIILIIHRQQFPLLLWSARWTFHFIWLLQNVTQRDPYLDTISKLLKNVHISSTK